MTCVLVWGASLRDILYFVWNCIWFHHIFAWWRISYLAYQLSQMWPKDHRRSGHTGLDEVVWSKVWRKPAVTQFSQFYRWRKNWLSERFTVVLHWYLSCIILSALVIWWWYIENKLINQNVWFVEKCMKIWRYRSFAHVCFSIWPKL